MKFWKIGLSVIAALLIVISIMNTITMDFRIYDNTATITPSIFYAGVMLIVLSIAILCAVIIICTTHIVKAMNNKNI